jgi:hypothetical protein
LMERIAGNSSTRTHREMPPDIAFTGPHRRAFSRFATTRAARRLG